MKMSFLRNSQYLENWFDAVIRTVLRIIKSEILEKVFDAVVVTMPINMFVYI